jgi:hypothetical protein
VILSVLRKMVLPLSLLAAVCAVALPGGHCLAQMHPRTSIAPAVQWQIFHEPRVPLAFSYPDSFQLRRRVSPQVGFLYGTIVKPGSHRGIYVWAADTNGLYATGPYAGMWIEKFAIERVKQQHGADGPDGTTYCTNVLRKKVVWNPAHLEVIEFFLTQVSKQINPPSTTQTEIGPFCVVLLPGTLIRALVFELTGPSPPPRGSNKLLAQIAESVHRAL